MDSYILSIDQGTTSSRAILFNTSAKINGLGQQDFPQIFPEPGWVEHDANAIWKSQWSAIERAIEDGGITHDSIAAIGITNQRLCGRRCGLSSSCRRWFQSRCDCFSNFRKIATFGIFPSLGRYRPERLEAFD